MVVSKIQTFNSIERECAKKSFKMMRRVDIKVDRVKGIAYRL